MADDHSKQESPPRFKIPLPGGRVAAVPLEVLEAHVDEDATLAHGYTPSPDGAAKAPHGTGGGAVTINIYTDRGQVAVSGPALGQGTGAHDEGDVVAHSLSVDPATGTSEWHSDWEFGECDYTDEMGFPQRLQAWHRHPFGTEYTEIYEP